MRISPSTERTVTPWPDKKVDGVLDHREQLVAGPASEPAPADRRGGTAGGLRTAPRDTPTSAVLGFTGVPQTYPPLFGEAQLDAAGYRAAIAALDL